MVSDPLEDGSAEHPFDAIQEGINAAVNGDTVLVLDGTYTGDGNRDLDFGGKAITVGSASGDPNTCIIDCEGSLQDLHRGFDFHNGEGPASVICGLTITGGYLHSSHPWEGNGGGVYCYDHSSPTLISCTISGNRVNTDGGGVFCWYYSSPTLIDCTISGNWADRYGGGVSCWRDSNPTLIDCTIHANTAGHGGGVYCWEDSSATLTNCTITGNRAEDGGGGGVSCCADSDSMLTNCTISGNTANRSGGVLCYAGSDLTLTNCTISGNSAYWGGGVLCDFSHPTLANCTISENSAYGAGGGVYSSWDSSPTLTNCTMTGNSATSGGGAMWCHDDPNEPLPLDVCVYNSILWGDTPDEIEGNTMRVVVQYSDVQGGWPGAGNIDADPLFVDPGSGDYRLSSSSPCIDAGDNAAVPSDSTDLDGDGDMDEPIPFDLDGNPRFVDDPDTEDTGNGTPPIVDMGAYEFQVGIVAYLDIKPGSCPNPLNRRSHGVLPVAIVGTAEFDVTRIDVDTLVLARADGVGGSVTPLMGPPGPGIHVEDVATPFEGEPCECHELGGDGIDDLSMKFDTEVVVSELELSDLPGGAMVELVVGGVMSDGTPFSASDCVRLVPPHSEGDLSRPVVGDDGRDVSPECDEAISPESFSTTDPPEQDADQGSGDADVSEESQGAFNAPIAASGAIPPAFLLVPIAALGLVRCRRH